MTPAEEARFITLWQQGASCAGGAGEDGWWLVAYSPSQSRNLTMWLTCATAAPAP